jgi:hypothetical protein
MNWSQMVNTDRSCSESYKSMPGRTDNSTHVSVDTATELYNIAERRQSICHCITFCIQPSLLCGIAVWHHALTLRVNQQGASTLPRGEGWSTVTASDIAFPS